MSDFQIEEDKTGMDNRFQSRTILGQPTTPNMVKVIMKAGFVKNEKAAGKALVILSAAFFLSAILIFVYFVL